MKIIGLTGSLAMGKSTSAAMLRRMGYPLFDADRAAREMTAPGGRAMRLIAKAFPRLISDGILNRRGMAALIFSDAEAKRKLEEILHPLVAEERDLFLARHRRYRSRMVILDIPLLYEKNLDHLCDAIILVTATAFLQRDRALQRAGMSEELLKHILASQLHDAEKRKRARYLVHTGLGKAHAWRQLKKIVRELADA